MPASTCGLKHFEWNDTPTDRISKLADHSAYITGNNITPRDPHRPPRLVLRQRPPARAKHPNGPLVNQRPPVDATTVTRPSLLTKEGISDVVVSVQILAPELEPIFTSELRSHTFDSLQRREVPFDWQHFPKVKHACMTRGNKKKLGERATLERRKKAVVAQIAAETKF
ncbi:hypothetical protein BJX63DRAFT_431723 [Aspergillus granulosus]|uniref:Uncharacterized protein n=1 Tax=Aspergillus granulosus TaxID=176169 RepID=A0ABR4HEF0_9EURO